MDTDGDCTAFLLPDAVVDSMSASSNGTDTRKSKPDDAQDKAEEHSNDECDGAGSKDSPFDGSGNALTPIIVPFFANMVQFVTRVCVCVCVCLSGL